MTNKLVLGDGIDSSSFVLNGADGSNKSIRFQTGELNRWIIRSDNEIETGGNAGSNFQVLRRNDAGDVLGKPLVIDRSTGNVGLNDVTSPTSALSVGAGVIEQSEISTPPTGLANSIRLFVEDDGSGKTRYMAQFGTGAAVQIAIEP